MKHLLTLTFTALLMGQLCACGQRGPLVHPGEAGLRPATPASAPVAH